MFIYEVVGFVMVAIGIVLLLAVYKNKFDRRNSSGIEEHKNFSNMVVVRSFEAAIWLFSYALIVGGILLGVLKGA